MFENIGNFFKKMMKSEQKELPVDTNSASKDAAKERLHIVLMQDRANVSADFLELMKQEIIDVIKKYIVIDEDQIDVRLTNQENEDGTTGAPSLYANIPILNIRNDIKGEVLGQTDKAPQMPKNEEKQEPPVEESNNSETSGIKTEVHEEVVNENIQENLTNSENSVESINSQDFSDSESSEEDDDDDVTFDDLLKAAEEEEKKEAEEKAKKETIKPKSVRKKAAGRKPSAKKKSSSSKSKTVSKKKK